MKRFVRFASGRVIDLTKVKLGYTVYQGPLFNSNGGQSSNEFIGQGDKTIWIQDIAELELNSDNPLELIELKKDMLEFRTVSGNKIRTFLGFVKPKTEKQSLKWKYQLDGAQCLERHIKAIWFRAGETFEKLELIKNGKEN